MTRERATGLLTMGLLLSWDDWIHRRIENVELKDPLRFMRRVSLDFRYQDVPAAEYSPEGAPILIVPLTFLRKRTLRNFSLRDETGAVLPLLTRTQNANVAAAVLATYAEWRADEVWEDDALKGRPLPRSVFDAFRHLARDSRDEAIRTWEELGQPVRGEGPSASRWREALVTDPTFMALARDFAFNYLALTPLVGRRRQRRIVKFHYEQVVEAPTSKLRVRLWERRERRAERKAERDLERVGGPRGRLTVAAELREKGRVEPCDNLEVLVVAKHGREFACTFRATGSKPLDIDLPIGAYEVRRSCPRVSPSSVLGRSA